MKYNSLVDQLDHIHRYNIDKNKSISLKHLERRNKVLRDENNQFITHMYVNNIASIINIVSQL